MDDFWAPDTVGTDAWVKVDLQGLKSFDLIALDRGHNLAGRTIRIQSSTDDFGAVVNDELVATIPSSVTPGSDITQADGVLTKEGAWISRLASPVTSRYVRLFIPGIASVTPRVVGLWIGQSWEPGSGWDLPLQDQLYDVSYPRADSPLGWQAVTQHTRRRAGHVEIRLDQSDEPLAEAAILDEFFRMRPIWIVHRLDEAEKAVLAIASPQRGGNRRDAGWFPDRTGFDWEELEPEPST